MVTKLDDDQIMGKVLCVLQIDRKMNASEIVSQENER